MLYIRGGPASTGKGSRLKVRASAGVVECECRLAWACSLENIGHRLDVFGEDPDVDTTR